VRASIIIVTYGQRAMTERCLASLDAALGDRLGRDWEIVLVDNNSPDDSAELLRGWSDRATVRLLDENRNFAGGCNVGAHAAHGEVLIFLNNDTEVTPGALETLVDQALEPGVAMAGARLLFPDGTIQHAGVAFMHNRTLQAPMPMHIFHHQDGELPAARGSYDLDCVTAACMAVRAAAFHAAGGFDIGFVNGLEDVDLCLKVRTQGSRIVYRGDAVVIHHEGASRGRGQQLWATPERLAVMASNDRRLIGRWAALLDQDDELAATLWDAELGQYAPPRDHPDADILVMGPPSAIGPGGDEARALLAAFDALGCSVAALDDPDSLVLPRPSGSLAEVARTARRRIPGPHATAINVPGGAADHWPLPQPSVVRLGRARTALNIADAAGVWAATPALAAELIGAGMAPERVRTVPPPVVGVAPGAGGHGILAILPTYDRAMTRLVLDALRALRGSSPVTLLPAIRTVGLAEEVAARLPGAQLLGPTSDELRFAELAGDADVVVAIDPADPFERRALVAAAAGAAPISLNPTGPAAVALADECCLAGTGSAPVTGSDVAAAIATALDAAGGGQTGRVAHAGRISSACGPVALAQLVGQQARAAA
jgi:GT2 family glycosyltransferase